MQAFDSEKEKNMDRSGSDKLKKGDITLFIGGFPPMTREKDIRLYFKDFKSLGEVKIVKGDNGQVKGFGYLTFKEPEEAEKAIGVHKIFGKMFRVNKMMTKEERFRQKQAEIRRKIFVGGLSRSTDETTLEKKFSKFGKLEDILINRDMKSKESKGCAFLLFKDEKIAQNLINLERKLKVDGQFVDIKKCHEKMKKKKVQNPTNMNFFNFVESMIQLENCFMGNFNLNYFQKKSINETFIEQFPQFQNQEFWQNQNMGYGNLSLAPPPNFQFAEHFQNKMNPERQPDYSREKFMDDFEGCPISRIFKKKPKEKVDYSDRESYSSILDSLKSINFDHRCFKLRFNKQVQNTWALIAERMMKKEKESNQAQLN